MKHKVIFATVTVLLIVLVSATAVMVNNAPTKNDSTRVGVTFGGDNSADAKLLIDRVKGYTNLFVVASGPLEYNSSELENTCDYAVKSGLDIIVYFGSYEAQRNITASFIDTAQSRWGSHFLGVYYGDEPSGKSLDGIMRLDNVPNIGNVSVSSHDLTVSQTSGSITTSKSFMYSPDFSGQINVQCSDFAAGNSTMIYYFPNGTITLAKNNEYLIYLTNGTVLKQISFPSAFPNPTNESWASNGTVLIQEGPFPTHSVSPPSFIAVTNRGNISQFEPYQQLWDSRPFQTTDDLSAVATSYVKTQQATTDWIVNQDKVNIFTSDYVLHWWDYQVGYDTVFAELGWNNTAAQEIGLVRGAANLQGKDWGTIIDWKYNQPPYLPSGNEMYNQMLLSYQCGAKYIVVFNYSENMTDPYGTLQNEHFQALQRFWTDVVKNPKIVNGEIKAEAVFVLPSNYGWGMRNPQDSIWGLWAPNATSEQIWTQLQNRLTQFGPKLDIVYDDATYPVAEKYNQTYFWNQTT